MIAAANVLLGPDVPVSESFRLLCSGETKILRPLHLVCRSCYRSLGGYVKAELVSHGICADCRARVFPRRASA